MRVLVYDTETGGTNPDKHSLLSLGALAGDLDTGEVFGQFELLHKLPSLDDYVIDQGAIEVHGITAAQCMAEGVLTDQIRDQFADLYYDNNCVLLGGHNVVFDENFVARQLFGISNSEFEQTFTYSKLDTLPVIRFFAGVEKMKQGATLKQTTKALGIDMSDIKSGGYHAALFDVIATFRIMCKFRKVLSDQAVVEMLTK
jgi:DNA polymerase III alpha subunit (gram-positive type)